ncbi:MAG: hypothetical protein OSJ74_02765 [Clostridia bacterium]|nr:hypothetical protein [Clostridia bacterium]
MKKKVFLCVSVVLLIVTIAVICAACTPNVDSLKSKVEAKGYTVHSYIADNGDGEENVAQVLYAYKDEENQDVELVVYWYFTESDAKAAYEKYSAEETKMYVVKKGKAVALGSKELCDLL